MDATSVDINKTPVALISTFAALVSSTTCKIRDPIIDMNASRSSTSSVGWSINYTFTHSTTSPAHG
jgi:hypothetical protein